MLLNNRHGSVDSDAYRYGFQGQERDDEVKGEGNSYNYTFRMHDPRLGRFFAVDPLSPKYPHYTPYQFSGNKVIQFVELEGLEEMTTTYHFEQHSTKPMMNLVDADFIVDDSKPKNRVYKMIYQGKEYEANSQQTLRGRDAAQEDQFLGHFSGVIELGDREISGILGYSDFVFGVFAGTDSVEETVLKQSNAGPYSAPSDLLDFKNRLGELFGVDNNQLYIINKIAYNANEAGNLLWAMVLEEHNFTVDAATLAEIGTAGREDEQNEQRAIINAKKARVNLNVDTSYRLNRQERYRDDYLDHRRNGGGRDNYTPYEGGLSIDEDKEEKK
jgi:RHS repeat-associated protein